MVGTHFFGMMTTAAVPFFVGRGYRVDNRADAPADVQASPVFQASSADTAVFMTLRLAGNTHFGDRIRMATAADAPALLDIYGPIVRHTALSFEVDPPSGKTTPYFVKTTQVDGHMAWVSPVYVVRK